MPGEAEPKPAGSRTPDDNRHGPGWLTALAEFDPRAPRDLIRAVLFVLLLFVAGALLLRFAGYGRALLAYPYDWDEDEGLYVGYAQRLAEGRPIYVDFNKLPMTSACYPPGFIAAVALLVPRLGPTLAAGRIVSLAALLGSAVVVILAVRQETRRWSLGLLGAALLLAGPYVTTWGPLSRVDSFALFLVLLGLLVVRQYPRSRAAMPVGLVCLLLACFTRYQSALLVPAAFWHLWRTGRRTAIVSLIVFAVAGLASLIWIQQWSGGWFWRSTITAQATEYIWGFFTQRTREFLQEHAILTAGALAWLVYQIARCEVDVWGALAILSVLNILLTGKQGAAINYYVPFIAAAGIGCAIAIDRLLRSVPSEWSAAVGSGLMLILTLQGVIWWLHPIGVPTEADRKAGDRIVNLIRSTKGDVLTERRVTFAMLAGRRPEFDACTLRFAYQIGRSDDPQAPRVTGAVCWDPAELVAALNEKRFGLILVAGEFFPPEAMTAIMLHYRELKGERFTIGNWHGSNKYFVMVPK